MSRTFVVLGFSCILAVFAGCGGDDSVTPFDGGRTDGGGGTDGGTTCPFGQTSCGGGCVNTSTDPNNCGMCGRLCAITESCSAGTCMTMMTCDPGMADCGAGCVDVTSDNANCGTCGRACGPDETCMMGTCATTTCGAGEMRCGAACVDTNMDPSNCGACGTACDTGEACVGGTCEEGCAAPSMVCDEMCVDTETDNANCGACGTACPAGQSCAGGDCGCGAGRMLCGGSCVDTMTDGANCGSCGNACPSGQTCAAGSCTCPAPTTLCSGMCTLTNVDSMNCGSCGTICSGGTPTCVSGSCMASSCTGGEIPCGGSCVNPQTSNMHCGGCGMACGAGTSCRTGVCRPANDLRAMATALTLTAGEVSRTGTTLNATKDNPTSGTECGGCTSGGNVWYSVTLAQAGALYVDTQGTAFDTKLFVTNSAGGVLTPGAGEQWCEDDNDCSGATGWGIRDARVYGWLAAGTYNISVGGCTTGNFTLHVQFIPTNISSYYYNVPIAGEAVTASTVLIGSSAAAGICGGSPSGEDARWFVTCGGQPQTFSLCRSDYVGFFVRTRPEYERTDGTTNFDPTVYIRSAQTGADVICNDDGSSMGGTDCRGYDSRSGTSAFVDGFEYGSRVNGVVAPRGINTVFVDSRSGMSGMNYRLLHRIQDAP